MDTYGLCFTAPAHLESACHTFTPADFLDLEREASYLARRAAWLSEYAALRGAAGRGDSGDTKARSAADKRLKRVRKAMGYSYP